MNKNKKYNVPGYPNRPNRNPAYTRSEIVSLLNCNNSI